MNSREPNETSPRAMDKTAEEVLKELRKEYKRQLAEQSAISRAHPSRFTLTWYSPAEDLPKYRLFPRIRQWIQKRNMARRLTLRTRYFR